MKIGYLLHSNFNKNSGVIKKVINQCIEWSNNDVEVVLYIFTKTKQLEEYFSESNFGFDIKVYSYKSGKNMFLEYRNRNKTLIKINEDFRLKQYDLIYTRHDLFYPAYSKILRENKVITEINSNELIEYRQTSLPLYIYHLLTRSQYLSNSSGLIFVTKELCEMPLFNKFQKQSVVIPNSSNISIFREPIIADRNTPKFVFIGEPGYSWHGIDKIIYLAKAFPQWEFDIIGYSESDFQTVIPKNVVCHGYLSKDDYDSIMRCATCAIGTLSLYEKNMNEASPLKFREYLMYGLPVIIGYVDTSYPNTQDFILQLPNVKNNVISNINKIQTFVEEWLNKKLLLKDIEVILPNNIEKKRLEFFNEVLKNTKKMDA
jgi:glycosyltransferase involved in cell wall biosynthesis